MSELVDRVRRNIERLDMPTGTDDPGLLALGAKPLAPHRASEAECQATIVQAARLSGWLVHAERPAATGRGYRTPIQGTPGFPDLVLVHPRSNVVLFVELKRRPNSVEPAQQTWIDALNAAHVEAHVVWVPEGLDAFCGYLARAGIDG